MFDVMTLLVTSMVFVSKGALCILRTWCDRLFVLYHNILASIFIDLQ